MARSAFVTTTTKWLELTGEWEGQRIEVKEHLGVADRKKIDGSGITSLRAANVTDRETAEASVDLQRMFLTQLKVYIVGWEGESFRDASGGTVEVSGSAIDMLEPDLADEMTARIKAWQEEVEREKAANPTTSTSSGRRSA